MEEQIDYEKLGKSVADHLQASGHVCNVQKEKLDALDSYTWAKLNANATDEDIANALRLGQSMSKSAAKNINSGGKIMFYLVGALASLLVLAGLTKAAASLLTWWITK